MASPQVGVILLGGIFFFLWSWCYRWSLLCVLPLFLYVWILSNLFLVFFILVLFASPLFEGLEHSNYRGKKKLGLCLFLYIFCIGVYLTPAFFCGGADKAINFIFSSLPMIYWLLHKCVDRYVG